MHKTNSYEDLRSLTNLKWALVVLTLLSFVVALVTFSVCIWIRFDLDFWEWVEEMNWYHYWYCMYVVMIAMAFLLAVSVLILYGTIMERKGLLVFGLCLLICIGLLEFIGAIVICLYGVEESHVLTKDLNKTFTRLIYNYDDDPRAARIMKIVQEYVGCCGAVGSEDYTNARKPVPWECRDRVGGNEYRYGCAQQFAWWLEPWSAALAGICVTMLIVHIVQMVVIGKLNKAIRRYQQVATGGDFQE